MLGNEHCRGVMASSNPAMGVGLVVRIVNSAALSLEIDSRRPKNPIELGAR